MKKCIFMAALALTFVACSNEDNDVQQPAQARSMHFEATIAAPNSGATTRTAYTESGTSINVEWKSGDQIALVHGGKKDVVTVGTPNTDGSAPITGTITVGADNEDIVLVYPADLVASATGGTVYTENATVTNKFTTQDGTLAYIQNNLDIRQGTGKLAVSGASASLKANVSMASQIAIWKLTMKDEGDGGIHSQNVTVKVDGNTVASASTTLDYFYNSIVYLALNPATMGTGALRIEADEPGYSTLYYYQKDGGVSLTAGKFYQSTLTMSEY